MRAALMCCAALNTTAQLQTPAAAEDTGAMRNEHRIQPYTANPRYWQYKGEPVLLLGGSKDDNLFQIPDLEEHLDELRSVGGNCIRNTMSDRQDFGFEVYPFKRRDDGKYDLNEWNDEYWRRFKTMLQLTAERDIVVQIEVWDRFDYSQQHWTPHPYNPANNVNYTTEETGLAVRYPAPAWRDRQPFFRSVPGMRRYRKRLDVVRKYQERFVAKMLSYSLDYGNVLYCMNNETSTPVRWGQHWMQFIVGRAKEKGVVVHVTDMFDDAWKPERSAKLKLAFKRPDLYTFLDVSQVNSRSFKEAHWTHFYWIVKQAEAAPRPLNHTKIYSDGRTKWGTGTPKDGIERFWRNLIGGAASCRFHRPGGGIGLNDIAKACIRSARKVETVVKFWDLAPQMELLSNREENEAYLAADPGKHYVLYFTDGGTVSLDMAGHGGDFKLKWIDIGTGEWAGEGELSGGDATAVSAPAKGPWVAVVSLSSSGGA